MVGGLRVGSCQLGNVKLQTVNHRTGVGVGLARFGHRRIGYHHGLPFRHVEGDERRACLDGALCRRGELLACGHYGAIDADVNQRLHLVLVRVVVVSLQRVLAWRHARDGQYERRRGIVDIGKVAVHDVCCQHLVGNHPQSLGLHVGLAPVAANVLGGPSGTYFDGHAVVKCLGVACSTGHGPRDVVDFGILAWGGLARQVEVDVLCSSVHNC